MTTQHLICTPRTQTDLLRQVLVNCPLSAVPCGRCSCRVYMGEKFSNNSSTNWPKFTQCFLAIEVPPRPRGQPGDDAWPVTPLVMRHGAQKAALLTSVPSATSATSCVKFWSPALGVCCRNKCYLDNVSMSQTPILRRYFVLVSAPYIRIHVDYLATCSVPLGRNRQRTRVPPNLEKLIDLRERCHPEQLPFCRPPEPVPPLRRPQREPWNPWWEHSFAWLTGLVVGWGWSLEFPRV